jgi:multidrug resistance efflux pump
MTTAHDHARKGRFSFRHAYAPSHMSTLATLQENRLPRVLRVLAWLVVIALLLTGLVLALMPWVQTTTGPGRVTTLDPRDRVQNISAMVSGRIAEWYVNDASSVKAGDPIVRIVDVDDELVARLDAQLQAAKRKLEAAREATRTAGLDLARREALFAEGLASRLDLEQASIRVQQLRITEEQAQGEVNDAEVNLSRQGSQLVVAPRDGTIMHVEAGDVATMVSAGQALATFMPAGTERVVEIYLEGRDIGLVHPGRKVRLQFDGWPAFQFSGLPEFAVGTFAGEVVFVEPNARMDGSFRVLVAEDKLEAGCFGVDTRPGLNVAGNCGWPPESFVRLGASVQGWVLLETVPLGYELWRRMNNFPPVNAAVTASGVLDSGAAK